MEIAINRLKRCALVAPNGRVDSATAPSLQAALDEVTEEGNFKLVLDMANVDFISSAGLWVLVNAQKKCKRFNRGELVIAGMTKRVHDALDLAGFIPYFKIFDDAASAVGNF
jgi:anti-sigma B factor antagonist